MPKKRFYDQSFDKKNGQMISGSVGIANMPQDVVMKYYPKDSNYFAEGLNDGITGIDSQKSEDGRIAKKNLNPSKV